MSNAPKLTVLPDYGSEANWIAFLSLFPESERLAAPSFAEVSENLDKLEEELAFDGVEFRRIDVDAAGWKSWVVANKQSMSRKSVPSYAIFKFAQEATGNPDIGVSSSV